MKKFRHFRQYLAKFFLEWEIFQLKVAEKIKAHILCSVTFCRKSCRLWDNVEKYSGAREATYDVSIWRIRVACWISKATCTHAHAYALALKHKHGRAHTQICNIYSFSTATMIRERASFLRYAYIVCLAYFCEVSVRQLFVFMFTTNIIGYLSSLFCQQSATAHYAIRTLTQNTTDSHFTRHNVTFVAFWIPVIVSLRYFSWVRRYRLVFNSLTVVNKIQTVRK